MKSDPKTEDVYAECRERPDRIIRQKGDYEGLRVRVEWRGLMPWAVILVGERAGMGFVPTFNELKFSDPASEVLF